MTLIAGLLDALDEHGVRTDVPKERYRAKLCAAKDVVETIRDFGELAEVDGICLDLARETQEMESSE